jgi:hypothetical protein
MRAGVQYHERKLHGLVIVSIRCGYYHSSLLLRGLDGRRNSLLLRTPPPCTVSMQRGASQRERTSAFVRGALQTAVAGLAEAYPLHARSAGTHRLRRGYRFLHGGLGLRGSRRRGFLLPKARAHIHAGLLHIHARSPHSWDAGGAVWSARRGPTLNIPVPPRQRLSSPPSLALQARQEALLLPPASATKADSSRQGL